MRRFAIFGDSISTFAGCNPEGFHVYYEGERLAQTGVKAPADTWWAQVIGHFGGKLAVNGSFSGSMVEGAGFPAGSSPERVAALLPEGAAPDDVIVFMGINDYGWGGPRAQAAARSAATPPCTDLASVPRAEAGLAPAGAADRFGRAYARMLSQMRAACPDARIWCCTLCPGRVAGAPDPTFVADFRGVPFDAYNDAIRAAAREHGCLVADVRALGCDYEAVDGTHPTARGMRQLAALVIQAMEEGAQAAPEAAGTGEGTGHGAAAVTGSGHRPQPLPDEPFGREMRSRDLCPGSPCVGCGHARGHGNSWFLVCERAVGGR